MSVRRTVRRLLVAVATGALSVSVAWAGIGLAPVSAPTALDELAPAAAAAADTAAGSAVAAAPAASAAAAPAAAHAVGAPVPGDGGPSQGLAGPDAGHLLVGASKVSLYPRPDDYQEQFPGARWERDPARCATLSGSFFSETAEDPGHAEHVVTATANPWPENPDCIYSGGFGLGPMNGLTEWDLAPDDPGYDESGFGTDDDPLTGHGLHVRAVAVSDGTDTFVLTLLDAEGYFWDYSTKCDDCGARQLTAALGEELDISPDGIVIASTHAHSAMDLIGGWGFVPDWYMQQVEDSIRTAVTEAVRGAVPAHVEVGEELARPHNSERRDTYRSAEEQQLAWLRATAVNPAGEPMPGATIATVGSFAAHPTSRGAGPRAHADWPALFATRVEERFGGVGVVFNTGLGNMSSTGGTMMGLPLGNLVPELGGGTVVTDTDVRVARATWVQPVTNAPLSALGLPGFFDREFLIQPTTITTGKNPTTSPCTSASPYGVELSASAARIGSQFAFTSAPGEVFSNLTNTIKERSGALVTMPIGQANDALGYMPQDFEINEVGQQALGFGLSGVAFIEYEDSYAIDHCTGDHVLETSLDLLAALR